MVGSGPAGLAAAQQLVRAGHEVTVYERDDAPGGLMRYGIPDFKLEKQHIDRRLEQLVAEGVRFEVGVEVGVAVTGETLRAEHDAVLLACGALAGRDTDTPGRSVARRAPRDGPPRAVQPGGGRAAEDDADRRRR